MMLSHHILQVIWWLIFGVVGSLLLMMSFVQGGQTLLWQAAGNDRQKSMLINSLGRKWELTFTTVVLFGGAMFAAFPKLYAVSFGGAYWIWMLILLTFVLQAVSYEYRKKQGNLFGERIYEAFLFLNGSLGIFLLGVTLATFFSGAPYTLNDYHLLNWQGPWRGLEALSSFFNLSLGLTLVFMARTLGALYFLNNIDFGPFPEMEVKLRRLAMWNFWLGAPFLLLFCVQLLLLDGGAINPARGEIVLQSGKYFANLLEMPIALVLLLLGITTGVWGFIKTVRASNNGIWFCGPSIILIGLALFIICGLNGTAFYHSTVDLQSSLTIYNASSSRYTLQIMFYVALLVPFVIGYIAYVWRLMDTGKLTLAEIEDEESESY